MTTTQTPSTTYPSRHVEARRPSVRRVVAVGVGATAAGAAVLLGYGALAIAVHGPMQVADHGASEAVPITASSFAIGVLFSSFFGVALAAALARWATYPARTFQRVAIVLTVVSLAAPLTASHTDDATRLWLAGGHVVAAAVIIALIVRALRTRLG